MLDSILELLSMQQFLISIVLFSVLNFLYHFDNNSFVHHWLSLIFQFHFVNWLLYLYIVNYQLHYYYSLLLIQILLMLYFLSIHIINKNKKILQFVFSNSQFLLNILHFVPSMLNKLDFSLFLLEILYVVMIYFHYLYYYFLLQNQSVELVFFDEVIVNDFLVVLDFDE